MMWRGSARIVTDGDREGNSDNVRRSVCLAAIVADGDRARDDFAQYAAQGGEGRPGGITRHRFGLVHHAGGVALPPVTGERDIQEQIRITRLRREALPKRIRENKKEEIFDAF